MSCFSYSWGWFFSPRKVLSIIWGNEHCVVGYNRWWGISYTWQRLYSVCCLWEFCDSCSVQELAAVTGQCPSTFTHPCIRHELRLCWASPALRSWQNGAGLLPSWGVGSALCLWSFTDSGWFRLWFFKKKSCCITGISSQLGSRQNNRMARLFILGTEWRRAGIILTSRCNQLSMYLTWQLSYIKRQCLGWWCITVILN